MILGIIAISMIIVVLGISLYCYFVCFYSSNKKQRDPYGPLRSEQAQALKEDIYSCTRRMDETPYEEVYIQSFDGLTLYGRYYHIKDGAPVQIIFHGYRSMVVRDCAGAFALAQKMGINVLAVDQRAHGKSEGHVITLGIWERRDCQSWIRYINGRFGSETPIILSGVSMGAATVVMATALPMPTNVLCALADSTYSSPIDILLKVANDKLLPSFLVYPFLRFAARAFGGFHLARASAIEAVEVSPIPILLIHGEDDRLVPIEMSEIMHYESNDCTRLVTFPEAGHGLSYITDPEAYEKSVCDFLMQFPVLRDYVNAALV